MTKRIRKKLVARIQKQRSKRLQRMPIIDPNKVQPGPNPLRRAYGFPPRQA